MDSWLWTTGIAMAQKKKAAFSVFSGGTMTYMTLPKWRRCDVVFNEENAISPKGPQVLPVEPRPHVRPMMPWPSSSNSGGVAKQVLSNSRCACGWNLPKARSLWGIFDSTKDLLCIYIYIIIIRRIIITIIIWYDIYIYSYLSSHPHKMRFRPLHVIPFYVFLPRLLQGYLIWTGGPLDQWSFPDLDVGWNICLGPCCFYPSNNFCL